MKSEENSRELHRLFTFNEPLGSIIQEANERCRLAIAIGGRIGYSLPFLCLDYVGIHCCGQPDSILKFN
ncbi:hypothetical protein QQG55_23040 [Brugia pahangi]|uniref:Uncharacterized protein n=1 Tax=Brugia pahangi TaxID=6280 RepID=A0A0N4TTB5_BRUPA|nr:unnamed protein product [Brugia pahangi]